MHRFKRFRQRNVRNRSSVRTYSSFRKHTNQRERERENSNSKTLFSKDWEREMSIQTTTTARHRHEVIVTVKASFGFSSVGVESATSEFKNCCIHRLTWGNMDISINSCTSTRCLLAQREKAVNPDYHNSTTQPYVIVTLKASFGSV